MLRLASLRVRSPRFRRLPLPLFLLLTACATLQAGTAPFTLVPTVIASGFKWTGGIAFDSNGNLYVADKNNGAVKEIEAVNGVIPSVNPVVKTLSSSFNQPYDVAVDSKGNVFVADSNASSVYEIEATSVGVFPASPTIRAFTSSDPTTNLSGSTAIAVDSNGNLYVGNSELYTIVEIQATSVGVYPTNPTIKLLDPSFPSYYPSGLAVDSLGNLFDSDGDNNYLYEVAATGVGVFPATPTITTLASGYHFLGTVRVDANGNLFYADEGEIGTEGGLYEIAATSLGVYPATPTVQTLGNVPYGFSVAPDRNGNLFVSTDASSGQVVEIPSGNFGSVPVGTPSLAQTFTFSFPNKTTIASIAFLTNGAPNLDFVVAKGDNCTLAYYLVANTCTLNVVFKPTAAGPRNGALVIYSGPNNTGTVLVSVPIYGVGTGPQIAYQPAAMTALSSWNGQYAGIAVDGNNNVFVADNTTYTVFEIAPNGTRTVYSSGYNSLGGLAVDGAGNLYIASPLGSGVYKLTPSGVQTTVGGGGWGYPTDVAVDGQGNVYAIDDVNVVKVTPAGVRTQVGSGFSQPKGVAVDSTGNVYVTDAGPSNVSKITPNGTQTVLGGGFSSPRGVKVDAAGDVYVADIDDTIAEITPAGGQSLLTNTSDGANFIAIDGVGNLYLPESSDDNIVKMQRSLPPTVTFPTKTSVGSTDTADGAQTVQIANVGNQPLVFTGLTYPTDFPESEKLPAVAPDAKPGLCTGSESLGAAEYCFLNIDFSPLSAGKLSENVTLTDNALNVAGATESIPVQGTGIITTQTINFPALAAQIIGTSWTLSATATSGLTVSFSSLTKSVCTVSGVKASFIAIGTCTIQATQPGGSGYTAAPPVNRSFSVIGQSQTITFPTVTAQTVGATPTLTGTASSGLTVSYTSLTPTVCSVSGVTASMIGAGICRIEATQSGSSLYAAAAGVYQYWQVNLITQTVSFTLPPTQHLLTNYTLSATATSSLAVSFTSSTPAVCTVSGTTLTPVAVGTCSITAAQAGNSTYASAGLLQNFHVALANQTINFTAPVNGAVGAKLTLSATASSGLTVSYASFSPSICTVSGNALTLVSSGPCSIQASQPGNATYAAALVVNQSIKVLGY